MIADIESDPIKAEWRKIGAREAARRRACAWADRGRRATAFVVLDEHWPLCWAVSAAVLVAYHCLAGGGLLGLVCCRAKPSKGSCCSRVKNACQGMSLRV